MPLNFAPEAAGSPDYQAPVPAAPIQESPYNALQLIDLFQQLKKESFDDRHFFEQVWQRDLWYVMGRQWIVWHPIRRTFIDKRLQKWIPRPVTNKMKETVQSIRANLIAIDLQVKARPISNDAGSIAAANVADQLSPLIQEEHSMTQVMREADFWLITTGNAVLQISWDLDKRSNRRFVGHEQCLQCGSVFPPQQITDNACPVCGGTQFQPAADEQGQPIGDYVTFGKGKTTALSPFEYAFPQNITRWDDLPYIIRMRWRDKHWFESNRPDLLTKISWEKAPTERSLQLFKALATTNDLGNAPSATSTGSSGSTSVEGVTEYEVWIKPTPDFPKGLVFRVIGDNNPQLLEVPDEGIPGPFPYTDIEGNPLFPFVHAQYEHVGGRLYGSSALSPLIQKQDQLNQLDSLVQLIIQRTANPVWVVPEGAGIDHFTGEPGLLMKWNPLAAGGAAKPERIGGEEVPSSVMLLREQIIDDIEDLSGAFDILKGQKPTGVEAFSALQLLVERSQSRFTGTFQSRGEMFRHWYGLAIELERQFGPDQRTQAVLGANNSYSFQHFNNAQLQGQITIHIEDGTNMPKTALGKRAAIEQANQLGLLNPADPDQRYALLSTFGLSDISPTLSYHVQAALQLQDEFERWVDMPEGPPPLVVKPWHDPQIHLTERVKWLNTDKMRELLKTRPELEPFIAMHLQELQMMAMPPVIDQSTGQPVAGPPQMTPGGQAMANSNAESTSTSNVPSGNQQGAQNQGPR